MKKRGKKGAKVPMQAAGILKKGSLFFDPLVELMAASGTPDQLRCIMTAVRLVQKCVMVEYVLS